MLARGTGSSQIQDFVLWIPVYNLSKDSIIYAKKFMCAHVKSLKKVRKS
jgi:hypothetical protein